MSQALCRYLESGRCQADSRQEWDNSGYSIGGKREISFHCDRDLLLHRDQSLPQHPNGMRITLYDAQKSILATRCYFPIGGGTVLDEVDIVNTAAEPVNSNGFDALHSAAALFSVSAAEMGCQGEIGVSSSMRNHAPNRLRHAKKVQGNLAGRIGGECRDLLSRAEKSIRFDACRSHGCAT